MSMPDPQYATQSLQLESGNSILVFYCGEEGPNEVLALFPENKCARNVFCIDPQKLALWQIQDTGFDFKDCYIACRVISKEVIAFTYYGYECRVDVDSGAIEVISWSRM